MDRAASKRYTPTSARSDGGSLGLLDEPHDVAVRVDLGDAELRGIVDVGEQDLRGGRRAVVVELGRGASRSASKRVDELLEALLEHVVAEVHHEVVVAEEVARR